MTYETIQTWADDLVKAGTIFDKAEEPATLWRLRGILDRWYYDVESALDADPKSPYRPCAYHVQSNINRLIDACDQACCKAGF